MVANCAVLGCKSKWTKGKHFFRFPREKDTRRPYWINFTKRINWVCKKSAIMCEAHFEPRFLSQNKTKKILSMEAVPTIHILKLEDGDEQVFMPFPEDPTLPRKKKRKKKQYPKKDPNKEARLEENRALKLHHKEVFRIKQRMSVIKQKICRFCFEEKSNTVPFANFVKWDIDVLGVLRSLELNTGYNDLLSEIVCEECFVQIHALSTFKTNCKNAELNILREMAQLDPDTIKITLDDEYIANSDEDLIKKEEILDVDDMIVHEEYQSDVDNYSDHIDTDEMEEERLELEEEEIPLKTLFQIERLKTEPDEVLYGENIIDESFTELEIENEQFVKVERSQEVHEEGIFVEQLITDGEDIGKIFLKDATKNKIILKIFDCPFCKKRFGGKKTFKSHKCNQKIIECDSCDKTFKKTQSYKLHHRAMHQKKKEHKCPMCKDAIIGSDIFFKKHLKTCPKKDDPVECEICQKVLPTLKGYNVHRMFHDSMPKNAGKSFLENDQPGMCEICGQNFNKTNTLKVHIKVKHSESHIEFKCDFCGKICNHRAALQKHRENVHKQLESPCGICGKVFKNAMLLRKHMMYHDESKRIHVCNICGKSYFTNVAMKRHQIGHTDLRPFSCDMCDVSYMRNQQLKMHKEKHHNFQYLHGQPQPHRSQGEHYPPSD